MSSELSSLADWDGTELWLIDPVEAGSIAGAEDAAGMGTVDAPCMTLEAAARSVVNVLAGIWAVEAASWLGVAAAELPLAAGLLGEGDIWLAEAEAGAAVPLSAGALVELAGDIDIEDAAPAGMEAEEGAEDEAALEGIPEIGAACPLAAPGTQPGTRAPGTAGAGPSEIATQPGKFDNRLPGSIFSSGMGFGAEHAFISSPV